MVRPGRYRHHKGKDYEVLGLARHSETEEEFVVYRPLYGDRALWVRPRAMFEETVEVEGTTVPRFAPADDPITLRTALRPGDLGAVVALHGTLYAREHGFDATFEAYVAGPLADFVRDHPERGRLWLAERDDRLVGCVAVVPASDETAQLRWFLVDPAARGTGLGTRLLNEAVAFSRQCGYQKIVLWTVSALAAAARLYQAAGFRKVEERPGRLLWGVDVIEEMYELVISSP